MIKVCHVTSVHPPKDVRIFHKECVSLAKAGYETYLVEPGPSMYEKGVQIIGLGKLPRNRIKRLLLGTIKVYKTIKNINADIYHIHDPELLPCGLLLKKQRKKVIFDSHEYYRVQLKGKPYLPSFLSNIISNVYGLFEDFTFKKIDGVIFPCTYQGKHPFSGKCKHLATVNNAPLLEELYDKYDESITKKNNSLCYIGSLTYSRGVTHAVKAAYESGKTLYLAGSFQSDEYKNNLFKLKEIQNTKYLGKMDRGGVLDLIQQSEIGMANLLNKGQYNAFDNLPTKAYEYMSLGVPVILSHSPYNDRIMEDYKFGVCVDPENIEDISNAIKGIISNKENATIMGLNGRNAIKSKFNWDIEFDNLLDLYKEIQD